MSRNQNPLLAVNITRRLFLGPGLTRSSEVFSRRKLFKMGRFTRPEIHVSDQQSRSQRSPSLFYWGLNQQMADWPKYTFGMKSELFIREENDLLKSAISRLKNVGSLKRWDFRLGHIREIIIQECTKYYISACRVLSKCVFIKLLFLA